MKHATLAALATLEPILQRLRAYPQLKERRHGVFYLRSRAFLHFHEDPAGLFADIRPPTEPDFIRLEIKAADAGANLIVLVKRALAD